MKQLLLTLLFMLILKSLLGQESKVKLKMGDETMIEGVYSIYKPSLMISRKYKDTTEAKNKTPEQLMASILSANTKSWEKYNALNFDENEEYNYANNQSLHYELLSKFSFKVDTVEMAIVKYRLINIEKKKSVLGITTM